MTAQGWAMPDSHPVAHFFVEGESLCRAWKYSGPLHAQGSPVFNCRRCTTLKGERASRCVVHVSKVSA